MLNRKTLLITLITGLATLVHADTETIQCNSTVSCPESAPCCSQYGVCGTGSTCLGGCHPGFSFSVDSCMPMPVCKNVDTRFRNFDDVLVSENYLGDPSDSNWLYSGYVLNYETDDSDEEAILLTMPVNSSGTVLSSSRYVWYGKVSATLKTSRGQGVVGSFILYSNAEDEIDWEFVGYNLTAAQQNYYYQGIEDWNNMIEATTSSSTFDEYHTYEIDWTESSITWSIDGVETRVLKKSDTYNSTTGVYSYPQTPSRVQFSLWPAGLSTNAEGTISWAGGVIDWDSEDIKDKGYYYVTLKNATIECYDPPSDATVNGTKSYVYTDATNFEQSSVAITDDETVLGSEDASGLDPSYGASSVESSSSSESSSLSKKSSAAKTSTSSASESSSATTSDKVSTTSTSKSSSSSISSQVSTEKSKSSLTESSTPATSSSKATTFVQATTTAGTSAEPSAQSSKNGGNILAQGSSSASLAMIIAGLFLL